MTAPSRNGDGSSGAFDLSKAAEAAIAEAMSHPFVFAYQGDMYELPNQKVWPLSAQARLVEDGDVAGFLEDITGDSTVYDRLVKAGLRTGELKFLMDAVAEAAGFDDLKNSPAARRRASARK